MTEFTLKHIEEVKGKVAFYKLVKNDTCFYDEFEQNLESKYLSELYTIVAYMNKVANGETCPDTKFKWLKTKKNDPVKEFEFKSKNIRVFGISFKGTGKIIILGGYKNKYKKTLESFRSIKKHYLYTINY